MASGPSPLFLAQRETLRRAAALGPVADLACGLGRHCLAAAAEGLPVVGFDRNAVSLRALQAEARRRALRVECVLADLEARHGIPLKPESCGAILVFRFLFRPLAATISEALVPGGLLLYETFTKAQLAFSSGPRNPDHLLAEGELVGLFPDLEILSHAEGLSPGEKPTTWARLAARKPSR